MELNIKHVHTYQELAKNQAVEPLSCGECGFNVYPGLTKDDKLYLKCYSCDTKFYPGLRIQEIIFNALGSSL